MENIYYINLTGFFEKKDTSIRDYIKLFVICDLVLDGKNIELIEEREKGFISVNSKLIADFYFRKMINDKMFYRSNKKANFLELENKKKILISFVDDNYSEENSEKLFDEHRLFLLTSEESKYIDLKQSIKVFSLADELTKENEIKRFLLKHTHIKCQKTDSLDKGIKRVINKMKYDLFIIDGDGDGNEIDLIEESSMHGIDKICVVQMEGENVDYLYNKLVSLNLDNLILFRKIDLVSLNELIRNSTNYFFTEKYNYITKYMK